jgi:hypothetical protein
MPVIRLPDHRGVIDDGEDMAKRAKCYLGTDFSRLIGETTNPTG